MVVSFRLDDEIVSKLNQAVQQFPWASRNYIVSRILNGCLTKMSEDDLFSLIAEIPPPEVEWEDVLITLV